MSGFYSLPTPPHFNPEKISEMWAVPYQALAVKAEKWAKDQHLQPANLDKKRIVLKLVDCQNVFCLPNYELFVAGQSGRGAVEDSKRICEFIYRYLGNITQIVATLDTHTAMQIFHPLFWINSESNHPEPFSIISSQDIANNTWQVNPAVLSYVTVHNLDYLKQYVMYYIKTLEKSGKYPLTIWPYHAMIGGVGHALVSAIEEACFFHTIARKTQTRYEIKGRYPLTEHYSVLCPEVTMDHEGEQLAEKNTDLINDLLQYDRLIIAGQAKSHCVAWSIAHLLDEIMQRDPKLAHKVYLLEDCTSAVVIPGKVDYTQAANEKFKLFSEAGMHLVKSTEPLETWPGFIT